MESIKRTVSGGNKQVISSTATDAQELLTTLKSVIAAAKSTQQNLLAREKNFEKRLAKAERFVDNNIKDIHATVNHFKIILETIEAKNWNAIIENMRISDQQKTQGLQELYTSAQKSIFESCKRVEQTASQIVKGIGKTLNTLHADDIEQLAEDCAKQVQKVSHSAVEQMSATVRWFHWKNLAAVFFISIMISLTIGLYINDEWPWEMHQTVVKQRAAGQAVLSNWNELSSADQNTLENSNVA